MAERLEARGGLRIEEGERILFDDVSRTYFRVGIKVLLNPEAYPPQRFLLLFTNPSGDRFGSFLVDGDFRLQYAEAHDLVALFRAIAPT